MICVKHAILEKKSRENIHLITLSWVRGVEEANKHKCVGVSYFELRNGLSASKEVHKHEIC